MPALEHLIGQPAAPGLRSRPVCGHQQRSARPRLGI
jgi:hypothetical protein